LEQRGPRWGGSPPRPRPKPPVEVPPPKQIWELTGSGLIASIALGSDGIGLTWHDVVWDRSDGEGPLACVDKLELGPLFVARTWGHMVSSANCSVNVGMVSSEPRSFGAFMRCPGGLDADFSAEIDELRSGGAALRMRTKLRGAHVSRVAVLVLKAGECSAPVPAGAASEVPGLPVIFDGARFALGGEHPLAASLFAAKARAYAEGSGYLSKVPIWVSEVSHVQSTEQDWGAVVVAAPERGGQMRRAFSEYLQAARHPAAWQGPMVHYNSWFDFRSWQEDGSANIALVNHLRPDVMTEKAVLDRIHGFEQLTDRGAPFHSFLLDDGWDDPDRLWTPDVVNFPNGLGKIADALDERLHAGLGIWLSPWGGYGGAKERRLNLAHAKGWTVNSGGLSLADKGYAAHFKEAVQRFRRELNVNMFKFDGFAGVEHERPQEVEAMLELIADLRGTCPASGERSTSRGSQENKDSFWINLTTGTWPSPFFLLWADSVWRGFGDVGSCKASAMSGLSPRQRWQVWRECVVHDHVVRKSPLFPLSRLMVHGAVLGLHGQALWKDLDKYSRADWAQEVWSLAALGLQLQELYISHSLMTDEAWDELTAALKWAKKRSRMLEDSHWAIPAECTMSDDDQEFLPYAVAAWADGTGMLMVRNPRNIPQMTPSFNFTTVLELPTDRPRCLAMEVVRSISAQRESLVEPLNCERLPGSKGTGRCHIQPDSNARFRMHPGELLLLDITISPCN